MGGTSDVCDVMAERSGADHGTEGGRGGTRRGVESVGRFLTGLLGSAELCWKVPESREGGLYCLGLVLTGRSASNTDFDGGWSMSEGTCRRRGRIPRRVWTARVFCV